MAYQITSGEIAAGVLYTVSGTQSVTYNSATYATGQQFRGLPGLKIFSYSGSGSQEVNEVQEFKGDAIAYLTISDDMPVFAETTMLHGMAIEFVLNDAEKVVNETTKIQGFALELIDYPFYSFEITETRL